MLYCARRLVSQWGRSAGKTCDMNAAPALRELHLHYNAGGVIRKKKKRRSRASVLGWRLRSRAPCPSPLRWPGSRIGSESVSRSRHPRGRPSQTRSHPCRLRRRRRRHRRRSHSDLCRYRCRLLQTMLSAQCCRLIISQNVEMNWRLELSQGLIVLIVLRTRDESKTRAFPYVYSPHLVMITVFMCELIPSSALYRKFVNVSIGGRVFAGMWVRNMYNMSSVFFSQECALGILRGGLM